MGILEVFLIGLGLSMDLFAVSVCKGLSMKKIDWKKAVTIGVYFAVFQALMPMLGYFLGSTFEHLITQVDHWIAFILLCVIGLNMIKESLSKDCEKHNDDISFRTMIVLAIATSIDALVVGITFSFFNTNLLLAIAILGIIAFIMSLIGVKVGNKFGDKYEKKAQFTGGLILILIGLKTLLEHLGVI